MGFLSNIFRSKKCIGTLEIKFYSEDTFSVLYNTDVTNRKVKELDLIQLFTLYYAKMLYNIGPMRNPAGFVADQLIVTMEGILRDKGKKGRKTNILQKGQKIIEPQSISETKVYTAELYKQPDRTRVIQTRMSWGEEGYYAPMSVVIFLQYLNKALPRNKLNFLEVALLSMNKYYQELGSYMDVRSIIEASKFGLDTAATFLPEQLNKG